MLPLTTMEQIVDVNYLYHRQQVSQFMAENAASEQARRAHRELAQIYSARIAQAKRTTSESVPA